MSRVVQYFILATSAGALLILGLFRESNTMIWIGFVCASIFSFLWETEVGLFVGLEAIKKPNKYEKRAVRQALIGLAIALPGVAWFLLDYQRTGAPGLLPTIIVFLGVILMGIGSVNAYSGWLSRSNGLDLTKFWKKPRSQQLFWVFLGLAVLIAFIFFFFYLSFRPL